MNSTLSPNRSPTVKRRPSSRRNRAGSHLPPHQTQETHDAALHEIRRFLKARSSYDAFPVSFRLIALDTKLNVKKALQWVVSAPLWNSEKSKFAGMLTVLDIIHLIQYYYHTASYEAAAADVEHFKLESLREIENKLGVAPPPLLRAHPSSTLFEAAKILIQTHARRLPFLDNDTETGHEVIISVLTQYRLLKFISINLNKEIGQLHLPLRRIKIGTYVQGPPLTGEPEEGHNPYAPIATATLTTPVFDVVHMFSEMQISAVPIIDEEGIVVNLYETVDVIANVQTLVRLGAYQSLDLTVSEALNQRSPDFPGVVVCTAHDSLSTLMQLIQKRRVHRLVVVEGEKGRLLGIITLSDVLRHIIGEAAIGEAVEPPASTTNSTAQPTPASGPTPAPTTPTPATPAVATEDEPTAILEVPVIEMAEPDVAAPLDAVEHDA
ncbi:CBS-domain-containing protein [Athelia psychrophila]|uniref:CBS-domain-containing protein n=1 Tax=Athelia psychrophila TaxID=1759441 RepID=A0A166U3R8_9AGAM|nr:CBS-domain-containing protein [Fibularhizoctonia sp. CBS 109695]